MNRTYKILAGLFAVLIVALLVSSMIGQGRAEKVRTLRGVNLVVDNDGTIGGDLTVTGILSAGSTVSNDSIGSKLVIRDSLHVYQGADVTGNLSVGGTSSLTGKTTFGGNGINYTLHAIAAGDSVFGHVILRSTDTVLVFWNGTAWKTIADVGN